MVASDNLTRPFHAEFSAYLPTLQHHVNSLKGMGVETFKKLAEVGVLGVQLGDRVILLEKITKLEVETPKICSFGR